MLRIEAGLIAAGQRVRRSDRPLRGRDRVHGRPPQRRGLRRSSGARGAPRAPAARARRSRARRQRGRRPRRPRLRRAPAGRRRHERRPAPRCSRRTSRSPAWRSQQADLGTALEVGKLDGQQKRIGAVVVRFPFYDPEKTRPRLVATWPLRRVLHRGAGRGVPSRRVPDRRGRAGLRDGARAPPRALRRLFDGDYETGHRARRGQLGGAGSRGPHAPALQRLEGRHGDRGAGAVGSHRPARRPADGLRRACGSCRTTSSGSRRGRRRSASTRTARTRTTWCRQRW